MSEAPDYSVLPPSSTFVPDGNDERYEAWSALLDASNEWAEAESTYTHPEYIDAAFLLHDVGVVELSEPIELEEYGKPAGSGLPRPVRRDCQASGAVRVRRIRPGRQRPQVLSRRRYAPEGGPSARQLPRRLRLPRHRREVLPAGPLDHGRHLFRRLGGPTFDISTPEIEEQNIIVAVTSFGLNYNCNTSGSYRIDQPDDLAFLADPAGAYRTEPGASHLPRAVEPRF